MLQLSGIARIRIVTGPLVNAWARVVGWWQSNGMWWAVSVTAHALVLSTVLLLLGNVPATRQLPPAQLSIVDTTIVPSAEEPLEMTPPSLVQPDKQLDLNVLTDIEPIALDGLPDTLNDGVDFSADGIVGDDRGGAIEGIGPLAELPSATSRSLNGHRDTLPERSSSRGTEGSREGSLDHRRIRRGPGGGPGIGGGRTKQGDRAVSNALAWIARHQSADGRWSLAEFSRQCTDGTCTCKAASSDTAATALALLPFLATGETHRTRSKYQTNLRYGLAWLAAQQKSDGDLRSGSGTMYSHGLATIALCEAYGMSRDEQLGAAASRAIQFILNAQDPVGGGWRYEPRQPGDLSVVGWQLMALKSGRMAGLSVPSEAFERAAKFVRSVGDNQGGFGYTEPGRTAAMSAVGLLCTQYLGAPKDDKTLRSGAQRLLANLPDNTNRNTYYWYYATQVMHNLHGSEWDTWNRRMRKVLIESQETKGCAAGCWSPDGHPFAEQGGRLMVTALNTLSLEVYYRYLPLYKIGR